MDSRIYWIGVAVLVGVGLIVPIQAEEWSLNVATVHRASTACTVLSAFESAAATPQTPEEPTAEEWLDRPVLRHGPRRAARRSQSPRITRSTSS